MTVLLADKAQASSPTPANDGNEVTCVVATYALTAGLGLADSIKMCKIPKGAVITSIKAVFPALDTGAAKVVTAATWSANVASITAVAHGFQVGQTVTIAFVVATNTPYTQYNVTAVIASLTSADIFTIPLVVADPGAGATFVGATATAAAMKFDIGDTDTSNRFLAADTTGRAGGSVTSTAHPYAVPSEEFVVFTCNPGPVISATSGNIVAVVKYVNV